MPNASAKNTTENKYPAPAFEKGLDIFELLSEHAHGLTQAEIAKSLGRSANESYRMLDTLVRRNYISTSLSAERYQLTMKLFTIAHRYPPLRRLMDQAIPLLRAATKKPFQSGLIGIEDCGDIVVIDEVSAIFADVAKDLSMSYATDRTEIKVVE